MKNFEVKGKIWRWKGDAPWHFVYVPEKLSRQIKDTTKGKKKVGFQFVRIKATLGKTSWNTTLFPTKDGPYLLAIKADVRHKEDVADGDMVDVKCTLL